MKRIVYWIFITILLCVFAVPVTSFAEEMTAQESEISGQVDELFEEHEVGFSYEDIVGLSFSEVANLLRNKIADELSAPLKLLVAILVVVIFTAVTQSAGESFFDRSYNNRKLLQYDDSGGIRGDSKALRELSYTAVKPYGHFCNNRQYFP